MWKYHISIIIPTILTIFMMIIIPIFFIFRNILHVPDNALCGYPIVKMEIRDSSQIPTTAPILLLYNYFRQKYLQIASCAVSLLKSIWIRVEHSPVQQLNFQKVNCNSSSVQAGCELYFGDELNTSLKTASNILYDGKNDEKYLYISDPIFTMLLAPEKKVILDFFLTIR